VVGKQLGDATRRSQNSRADRVANDDGEAKHETKNAQ
jgi:hypothetical protein